MLVLIREEHEKIKIYGVPDHPGIIKQQESGKQVAGICREHGISQASFYGWKSKYWGLEVSQLKRMKELEAELAPYKKIVAEPVLQISVLKDVVEKKLWGLPEAGAGGLCV